MLQWILIFALLLIAGFIFLKFDHQRRRIFWIAIVIIILVVLVSVLAFLRSETIDVNTPSGTINAVYSYVGWVGNAVTNLWEAKDDVVDIVGDAIEYNSTTRGRLEK